MAHDTNSKRFQGNREKSETAKFQVRQMQHEEFRNRQEEMLAQHRQDLRPVNDLVIKIMKEKTNSFVPRIAPTFGGTQAKILILLQDPGPRTRPQSGGSGFLSHQNDDPTAECIARALENADLLDNNGIATQVIAWNAYPWWIDRENNIMRPPTVKELREGLKPLSAVLKLITELKIVILCGRKAEKSWDLLQHDINKNKTDDEIKKIYCNIVTIPTVHPSPKGLTKGGRQTADIGRKNLFEAFVKAKNV